MTKFAIICLFNLFSWTWFSNTLTFDKRITAIHIKVVDLTDIFALHDVKEFSEVYFNPAKFQDSVINYLKLPKGEEEKLIAVYSMTKLPMDRYVSFLNSCYSCYNQKR